MSIVVFDVDRTLIRGNSLILAARKSNSLFDLIWFSMIFLPYLIAWKFRLIKTKRIKELFIDRFQICKRYNDKIANNKPDYWIEDIKKVINKEALNRLYMHKEKGDIVILCSASPDMILEPLAKALNVELICTKLSKIENQWQAKIKGENCNGLEKLKRLQEKYGSLENHKLEVYGDSRGDKEILNSAFIPHYRDFSDYPKIYPIFSLNSLIPIAAIAFLIYLILDKFEIIINPKEQWDDIWLNIIIGEFLIIISYIIRFFRWKIILESINLNPPNLKNIYIWMGSFAFTATPGKTGEGIRAILLNKECNLPVKPVLISLIIERLTDAIAVLIILFTNSNLIPIINFQNNLNFVLLALILMVLSILLLNKRKRIKSYLIVMLGRILPNKKIKLTNKNLEVIRILISPKNITISTILGLLAWVIEGSSFFIILKGFNLSISWLNSIFAHTTSSLIGALTLMPGGLGTTEASTIGLLSLQGIPVSIGTSATLLFRLMTLWFATILGIIFLILNKYKVRINTEHSPINQASN